jgi:hypothetical protein
VSARTGLGQSPTKFPKAGLSVQCYVSRHNIVFVSLHDIATHASFFQDFILASAWAARAADSGSMEGCAMAAQYAEQGRGMERNDIKAVEWYTKAACGGHVASQVCAPTCLRMRMHSCVCVFRYPCKPHKQKAFVYACA